MDGTQNHSYTSHRIPAKATILCPYLGRKANRAKNYSLTFCIWQNCFMSTWSKDHGFRKNYLNSVQKNNLRTISQADNSSGAISDMDKNLGQIGSSDEFYICLSLGHEQMIKKSWQHPCDHCYDRTGRRRLSALLFCCLAHAWWCSSCSPQLVSEPNWLQACLAKTVCHPRGVFLCSTFVPLRSTLFLHVYQCKKLAFGTFFLAIV